jgi:hypothetical protein
MRSTLKGRMAGGLVGLALLSGMARPATGQTQGNAPLNDASAKGAMAVYQDFTKYPPESRPLNPSNWDLLHPWSADTPSAPMIPRPLMRQVEALRAAGASDDEALRSVALPASLPRYQFEMNKTILAGTRDELQARLTVTADQNSSAPVPIQVTGAEVIGDADFGSPRLDAATFSCDSVSCTFRWKAPAAQKQYWGALQLVVSLTMEGSADGYVIRQPFYSSPMVAGKFTGQFGERLENGSLVIDAGVEVQRHMACFVSANLFSIDRAMPTHHVERRMIVDPTMKTISFTFFGKVFRDFGHEGAFRVQDLKAQCENLAYPPEWFIDSLGHQAELQDFQSKAPAAQEPSRIYFEYNNYSYTTRRYAGSVFSDQEWQSPEKLRKLEMFKKAAADLDNPAMDARKRQLQQQVK